jgi:hypothetical protein
MPRAFGSETAADTSARVRSALRRSSRTICRTRGMSASGTASRCRSLFGAESSLNRPELCGRLMPVRARLNAHSGHNAAGTVSLTCPIRVAAAPGAMPDTDTLGATQTSLGPGSQPSRDRVPDAHVPDHNEPERVAAREGQTGSCH